MNAKPPILISFYSDDAYYSEAAKTLAADCDRLGVDHDLVALGDTSSKSWIEICRSKVPFYRSMLIKHKRPVFWLDIDSRLAKRLQLFDGAACDMAGFLRGQRYLRDMDPALLPRFFAPFALYFNYSNAACAFLDLMQKIESTSDFAATDDYFLQEAWLTHREPLSVLVLPPHLAGRTWPPTPQQVLGIGSSGNVSSNIGAARQHEVAVLSTERRSAVLVHEAKQALAAGRNEEAVVYYRRLSEINPANTEFARLAQRLASPPRPPDGLRGLLRRIYRQSP
jgi:hypothetical protein